MNARVGGKANDRPSSFFGFSLCTPGLSQPRGGEGEKEVSGTLSIGSRKNYKMNEKKRNGNAAAISFTRRRWKIKIVRRPTGNQSNY
jgi:hypothetical protein